MGGLLYILMSNFLAPVAFQLDIPFFKEVSFQCNEANIPGISMEGPQQATVYNDFQLSGDKLNYEDFTISFLVDEDMRNYSIIHNWMTGITYPQKAGQWREFANAMRAKEHKGDDVERLDLTLRILNSSFNTQTVVKIYDAFPVAITSLPFSVDTNDIQYLTADVTFKYTYFKLLDKNDKELTL